jgi:antitoxin CptB
METIKKNTEEKWGLTPIFQRLRWQCRRGMLELDYVLENYLEQQYSNASGEEQALFARLLQCQDPELQAWILEGNITMEHEFYAVVQKLRTH